MAYNTSVHASTGFSPFYLMYGGQARLPVDAMYGTTRPVAHQSPNEYAANLDKQLKSAFELAHKTAGVQCERQKHHYDQKVHGNSHNPGDLMWLLNPKVPKNSGKKLFHPWTGPFKVLKQLSECTYRVQKLEGKRHRQVVHFNRLKPCPKDIRLNSDGQPGQTMSPEKRTTEVQDQRPPQSVVELIDDDDELAVDHPTTTPPSHQPIQQRRNPPWQRHPPVRLQDYVRS